MTRSRLALLSFLVLTIGLLSACSALGKSRKQAMLDTAPVGYDVQLITLNVQDTRYGRLTVEEAVVDILSRREGILDVRRGSGREELYVLTETFVDPYDIPRSVPDRFIVRVMSVEKPSTVPVPGVDD